MEKEDIIKLMLFMLKYRNEKKVYYMIKVVKSKYM